MSSDKQKGRADAAKGKYDPPSAPFAGLFSSKSETNHMSQRAQNYREGYYDKKNEMRKK